MNSRISALLSTSTPHSRKDDASTINAPPSASFGELSLPWQAIAASLDANTSRALADRVMRWALKNGATHHAHWFHPLTGVPVRVADDLWPLPKYREMLFCGV